MPLDPQRLEGLRASPEGGFLGRCPACAAEEGGDHHKRHLRIWPTGAFCCAAHPGDHLHRQIIWKLAGTGSVTRPPRVVLMRENKEKAWREAARCRRTQILATPGTGFGQPSAPIPRSPLEQCRAMIGLFAPDDVVWTGELWDSGSARAASHFRSAREWLLSPLLPGPRICACSFREGVITRSQRTVAHQRFLVVESDSLSHVEQMGLIRWLSLSLRLRAVVDTGRRSLHAWFDSPAGKKDRLALECMLPCLGADPSLLNPAQPWRMPGWPRSDSSQSPKLIHLAP